MCETYNEIANNGAATVERFDQPVQAISIELVPLARDIGRDSPDFIQVHLLCQSERRFEGVPASHVLVDVVFGVDSLQGRIGETPFADVKTVSLIYESRSIPAASLPVACEYSAEVGGVLNKPCAVTS
jgi:hypothetical protein